MRLVLLLAFAFSFVVTAAAHAQAPLSASQFARPDGTLDVSSAPPGALDLTGLDVRFGSDGQLRVAEPGQYRSISTEPFGPGLNGSISVLAVGPDGTMYAGGRFTAAGTRAVQRIASWDGDQWSTVGGGTNGPVTSIAFGPDGALYAGGPFSQAGGRSANGIARWDGASWSTFGTGFNGTVNTIAFSPSGVLHVAGSFTSAGGLAVNNIARWTGTSWDRLGYGLTFPATVVTFTVYHIAFAPNGDLFAGGTFIRAGAVTALGLARWDGSAWSSDLGNRFATAATSKIVFYPDGTAYARGRYVLASGPEQYLTARWNGSQWDPIGPPRLESTGFYQSGTIERSPDGTLYGSNSVADSLGYEHNEVATWNGSAWDRIGATPTRVASNFLFASDGIYTTAAFCNQTREFLGDCIVQNALSRFDGTAWIPLGSSLTGLVQATAVAPDGSVYVAGEFTLPTRDGYVAYDVARWDGSAWYALPSRPSGRTFSDGRVYALAIGPNGDLYVGGSFTTFAGVPAASVARWNGSEWSALAGGIDGVPGSPGVPSGPGTVNALAFGPDGILYAGGTFPSADVVSARNVAAWDGTSWSALGNGLDASFGGSSVTHLTVATDGRLYAAGTFYRSGAVTLDRIAMWDGSSWRALGTYGATANSLTSGSDGSVYAGSGVNVGGVYRSRVLRWTGQSWLQVGGDFSSSVYAVVAYPDGSVYAGGSFSTVAGVPARGVAKWTGSAWVPIADGAFAANQGQARVMALARLNNGDLLIGGWFDTIGGTYSPGVALFDARPVAAEAPPEARDLTISLSPNPSRGSATAMLDLTGTAATVGIYDALGRRVGEIAVPAQSGRVNVALPTERLAPGVYVVRLTSGRSVGTARLVIAR